MTCTCGATFTTRSTAENGVIHADVCSQCHPFYTGKQKILDTGGRVARFEKRYARVVTSPRAGPRASTACRPGAVCCQRKFRREECTMFEAVQTLKAEYAELERQMSDPELHSDQANARRVGKRYAALAPVVRTYDEWLQTEDDIGPRGSWRPKTRRSRRRPPSWEPPRGAGREAAGAAGPARPDDDKDVILEIKAGEGGDESALFAGDLLRMYLRYAETQDWKTEVLDSAESDLAGTSRSPSR